MRDFIYICTMEKKIYFSSDWHLGHKNVIKYDNRPFDTVESMNETIINNYNNIVNDEDDFYFLGDFSFDQKRTEEFLSRLKGNLHFIKGNHDYRDTIDLYKQYGKYLGEQTMIKVKEHEIVLNHYTMAVWNKSHHGSWHLYGHSHGNFPENNTALRFDVGCMNFDYKPIEFEEVKLIMSKKDFKPINHRYK